MSSRASSRETDTPYSSACTAARSTLTYTSPGNGRADPRRVHEGGHASTSVRLVDAAKTAALARIRVFDEHDPHLVRGVFALEDASGETRERLRDRRRSILCVFPRRSSHTARHRTRRSRLLMELRAACCGYCTRPSEAGEDPHEALAHPRRTPRSSGCTDRLPFVHPRVEDPLHHGTDPARRGLDERPRLLAVGQQRDPPSPSTVASGRDNGNPARRSMRRFRAPSGRRTT